MNTHTQRRFSQNSSICGLYTYLRCSMEIYYYFTGFFFFPIEIHYIYGLVITIYTTIVNGSRRPFSEKHTTNGTIKNINMPTSDAFQ